MKTIHIRNLNNQGDKIAYTADVKEELREAVEKAEWNEKVERLALTDTNVATKLQAIKGKQDTISSVNLKG